MVLLGIPSTLSQGRSLQAEMRRDCRELARSRPWQSLIALLRASIIGVHLCPPDALSLCSLHRFGAAHQPSFQSLRIMMT